jgi:pectin methylesterase-like acyl-CoA thioesterase
MFSALKLSEKFELTGVTNIIHRKGGFRMRTLLKQIVAGLFVLSISSTLVHADFYVIPVNKKMKNVIIVAKSGGQYTDVKTAIDSISDAGPGNPYLVYIGPGAYTVTSPIQLKAYVTVMGSGRDATLLKGAVSSDNKFDSAVIRGASNATLTQLSVENIGGDDRSIGIYNNGDSPVLDDIAVTASGGVYNSAIYSEFSSPTITNVSATASGGDTVYSVYSVNAAEVSPPIIRNCTIKATGGSPDTFAVSHVTVLHSIVTGGGRNDAVCHSCFDEDGIALDATCN